MPRLDLYMLYELQASIVLEADEVQIGRDLSCAVVIPDDHVSRVHAVLRKTAEGHVIENKSSNGTRLNDDPIETPQELRPGDSIQIAQCLLIYQSDDCPPAEDPRTVTRR